MSTFYFSPLTLLFPDFVYILQLLQIEKTTLEELYQASLCLDQEQTTKIIALIALQDPTIGGWLAHLLDGFKFENIIEQLEIVLEPNSCG